MKRISSYLVAVLALLLTFNVSAQTLLYDAAGTGNEFVKVGGTKDYSLNLNGNAVTDGTIVMTAGQKAVSITIDPAIPSVIGGGGISVVMYVSDVDVTKGGEFVSLGESESSRRGGVKIKTGTTDGTLIGSWQNGEFQNAFATKFPTDKSANVISYTYKRTNDGGGKGSAFYLNGNLINTNGALQWNETNAYVAIGGVNATSSTYLNEGMKIHRVQIYAGELTHEQIKAAETSIKETPTFPEPPLVETATPAADDGKWYYVKSQRSSVVSNVSAAMNVPNFWTLQADGKIKGNALTFTEDQLFQLFTSTEGKVSFKAKNGHTATKSGQFIILVADGTVPTGWTILPNTVDGVQGYAFQGEGNGLHQGAGGHQWAIMDYFDLGDNCTFFFYEATDDFKIRTTIESAQSILSSTLIGTSLGYTTQENIDIYQTAINEAKKTLGSSDPDLINNAIAALNQATQVFQDSKVKLVSSTHEQPFYYFIESKNNSDYSNGKVIYTTGANTQCKWGDKEPTTLNMLFRVEKHAENNTYRIINAAFPLGELKSPEYGTESGINYWTIQELLGDKGPQYKITKDGMILHAQQAGNALVNYGGEYGTASAWTFEPFTGDIMDLYQVQYTALVNEYNALVDLEGNPIGYTLGTGVGNYSQEAFDAIKTTYAQMLEDYTSQSGNLGISIGEAATAISTFKSSQVHPKPFNGTFPEGAVYGLRYVNPDSPLNGHYLSNPLAADAADDSRARASLAETFNASTCSWKLKPSTSTTGKYVIMATRRDFEYIDEEGRVVHSITEANTDNEWTTKTLLQNEETWNDGTSLLVIKIDKHNEYFFNNQTDGTLGRNKSQWSYYKLEIITATSTDETSQTIRPVVINGSIVIGEEKVIDVYTLTGVQVQNKNLKSGIYIAKANGISHKVIIK